MNQPALYTAIAYALWGILGFIWILFTFTNKRTVQKEGSRGRLAVLLVLIIGYVITFSQHIPLPIIGYAFIITPALGWVGVFVTACGVVLAVWARFVIGRNWSGSGITLKENHELVQSGAYRIVRHPIYTGLLLAAIGVVIAEAAPFNFVGVLLIAVAFLIRIPKEERLMMKQFPTQYPVYANKVKKLIPFVW